MAMALFSCRAPTNFTPRPSSVTARTAVSSLMSPNTVRIPRAWMSSARTWNTGAIRLSFISFPLWAGSVVSILARRPVSTSRSAIHDDLVDHAPPGSLEIQTVRVVLRCPAALCRLPGGFHCVPVIEPELHHDVPGRIAPLIGLYEVLHIAAHSRNRRRQGAVRLLEVPAKLLSRQVRATIAHDNELEHGCAS